MEQNPSQQPPPQPPDEIVPTAPGMPVIGIGASSGGLGALQRFFAQMPADSGMSFVVILHLSPEYKSHAAAVIQQATTIPVTQVTEAVAIVPNHIYVIPPNQYLSIEDGILQLRDLEEPRGRRAPIDMFFRDLAEAQGHNAAAIVLSGSGADGTIGVKRIKECGGVVLAQDPQEAEFDSMPRSAIATGLVDFVLPVAAMPASLIAFWSSVETLRLPDTDVLHHDTDTDVLREIFALLRARTGHDFSQYKLATLLRRIGRRMQVHGVADLPTYLGLLRSHSGEIQALLRDLLISVTNFFRDQPAWLALETAIPKLFDGKDANDQVRAWVAGCATGEEAYSIALLLYEHARTLDQAPTIQVFATDIDESAIAIARHGLYPDTIAADVSPERLQRFFIAEQGQYRIKREVRDLVLFAPHNLLRDPPFSKLGLITCRNLLIYLNREVQEQILQLFHFVLRLDGYLLLGASESTDGVPSLFTPINKVQRLFQRRTLPTSALASVPALPLAGPPHRQPGVGHMTSEGSIRSFGELHTRLLTHYTPPSVMVNQDYEIVHLSHGAGRFLQFVEGEPSHSLLKVVDPGLRIELRTALFAALQGGGIETRRGQIRLDKTARLIDLIVQPIQEPEWARGHMLVIFKDLADASDIERGPISDAEPMVRQIEEELQRTKDHLRMTIEQYETAVEEYKAANEELQAVNEELRAASEELETSKEELQAVNEELTTVNQELKHKVEEISQSNNDLQNLIASTEIGTIFVNRELRIKRYTPSAQVLFNLIPADINRPLAHITHKLNYDQLGADTTEVLERLTKMEHEVSSQDGRWYLARLLPYYSAGDKIDGVILTFIDITDRKWAEDSLRESEERLRLVIESVQEYAIFTINPEQHIDSWNPAAERMLGFVGAEVIGQNGAMIFTPEDYTRGEPGREIQAALAEGRAEGERWYIRKDGSRFYADSVMTPLRDGVDNLHGFVKVMRDLTRRKLAEEALRQAQETLERRVEDRTRALADANQQLQVEVVERERLETARVEVMHRLVTAQEEERRRIARELHDQFGQQLSALRLGLSGLTGPESTNLRDAVTRLQQIAAQLDQDVDRLTIELRPTTLDDLGLRVALQQHVEEWAERHSIPAEFQATGIDHLLIPPEIEIVIYRVTQEALTNVLKHADARHVSVILERRDDQVVAIVEDDGSGFDPEAVQQGAEPQHRLGLLGMQERAALVGGTLTIESAPGHGTTVFVHIPLLRTAGDDDHA